MGQRVNETRQSTQPLVLQDPKLELELSNTWQSMTSLPEPTLGLAEDGGQTRVSHPTHSATPLQAVLHFEAPGVLEEEDFTQAAEFSAPQGGEHAQVSVSPSGSVIAPENVPGPSGRPGPGFTQAPWFRPGLAPPGAWPFSPRGWPGANVWPMLNMGTFHPSLGPFGPQGLLYRAPFPGMEAEPQWPQLWPRHQVPKAGTRQLSDVEERRDESEYDYVAPFQEAIPKDGAPQDAVSEEGAPQDGIPKEGAPQDGISKEGAPRDGIRKVRVSHHRVTKGGASKRRTHKDGAPHEASQDTVPEAMDYRDRSQKDVTPGARPKSSQSALKKLKSAIAIAAATAAAYASAANTAARAAKAAVKSVKDVPAAQMTSLASTLAEAGPFGAFADVLGAGSSRGATDIDITPFSEDDLEDFPEEFISVLHPMTPRSVLSQAMITAMQAESPEDKKKAVKYSMSHIAQMPMRHDSLKEEFDLLSTSLHQRLNYLGRPGQPRGGQHRLRPSL